MEEKLKFQSLHDSLTGLFKEADNNMYREKLHRSKSTRRFHGDG